MAADRQDGPPPLRAGVSIILFRLLNFGAGEEIRTLDPNLGKVVLYH